jgi:predicted P-loop ATPase
VPGDLPCGPENVASFVDGVLAPWHAKLIVTKTGAPRALLANAVIAFREAPQWVGILHFDAFHQRTMLRGKAAWSASGGERAWTPADDLRAAEWLQHQGIAVFPDTAGQAIELVARENIFHPVLDYLNRCRWDGKPRLDNWTITWLGCENTPYVRVVSARWMIAAVARVMQPGCKADCALILEGKQGSLKSTALRTLAHPWFTDEVADFGTKDAAMQLGGAWIIEIAELDNLRRADVARIKAFLSRTVDRFRPPYGRRVIEQPRQCIFAGTVNDNEYLRDETGGRRFWPLACRTIDIVGLAAARDQLWAEARDRYLADEPWWLDTAELSEAAAQEQVARYRPDPWQSTIEQQVVGLPSIRIDEALNTLGIAAAKHTQQDANRIATCLKVLGWRRRQVRVPGTTKREYRYMPPS